MYLDRCDGGYTLEAWKYVQENGTCSGGLYLARGCCKPYSFHPCGEHAGQPYYGECEKDNEDTPVCREKCQFVYRKRYADDKIYAKSAYLVDQDEEAIQKEIMTGGPVQAAFLVYLDFHFYSGGVYVHSIDWLVGAHAIKIIGWGVEDGLKYWLVANSWNSDWGEEGYFKILRGNNECEIESEVIAGVMKV
ncbi:unnamed protein product [Cylicocyclus nassatus]|uniref:Peptidase C1A papain C-terminal domain-containing protein n=1 Tax=Cylicocyclus nassatus TaxID=53992 RepID=A0AA36GMC7_CYLNA|nr:unnamed protein product [Cylicocyclus nassatus]